MARDRFGRVIDYLRISVVDHCNFRCIYCMPSTAVPRLPKAELLTAAEIEAVVRAAVRVGFRKFRLTGGEPTLRADLVEVVERITSVPGVADLSMTTNGVLLRGLARPLAAAGLRRVNVHLDSVTQSRLAAISRHGRVDQIWAGIVAAEEAGLTPIKLNAVVVRGGNEDDVVPLAALTLDRPWHVRFIETMPVGAGEPAEVARQRFVPSAETHAAIEAALGSLTQLPKSHPSEESLNYALPGAAGVVGFVSPVSKPYCHACNRMRLTADGRLRLCLLHDDEIDLRGVLRAGGGEAEVSALVLAAVARKPMGHDLDAGRAPAGRSMLQIGG
ncbi:MAG: GTP 3',8-cyclase MoaA [Candidatus Binatia bacterium]